MGALTSNRKRGDDYFTVNYKTPASNSPRFDLLDGRISKKTKLSPSINQSFDRNLPSNSIISRLFRYPDSKPRFPRAVHAPSRLSRFRSSLSGPRASSGDNSADNMGNYISRKLENAKKIAFDSLRHVDKDKEVIEVDSESDKEEVAEDSSIEEVENVGDEREDKLRAVSELKGKEERNRAVAISARIDGKGVGRKFQPSSSSGVSELSNSDFKVETAEKMLDSLSLSQKLDASSVPLHKKLHDSAEKRNNKLMKLKFEIELNETHRQTLQLLRPQKKAEVTKEDVVREPFLPLTEEEEDEVAHAFLKSNRRKVLVSHENSNIDITGEVLQCLRPGAWLNDEVINVYLELLKEREKREPKKYLKCHFFNTFFYKKLTSGRNSYNYQSVKRWTTQRKLGYCLLECDKIFVPIHKEVHWCLAVINKKDKKFQYLDSLGGYDSQVMKVLSRYFIDEVKDKSGEDIDVSSWEQEFVQDLPEQENGFDCGMFMIKYADFYSRNIGLCFNQEHMPYFRKRTVKEILRLKAE